MKRIILCLDGTWNNTFQKEKKLDGSKVVKPSNVLKTARSIVPIDEKNVQQIVYYDAGVGSLPSYGGVANYVLGKTDNFLGGAFAAGLETNTEEAINFLVNNYTEGDEIFIFGFSRGAATARIVCNILSWMRKLLPKKHAYYLPHLIRAFFKNGIKKDIFEVFRNNECSQAPNDYKELKSFKIQFVGLWDTVLAKKTLFRKDQTHLISASMPTIITHAAHALALDEKRYDFLPSVWTQKSQEQTLEQRWFAGVHSNIGGSYPEDGLANCTLSWIIFKANMLGLQFDSEIYSHYKPYPAHTLYNSHTITYKALDYFRKVITLKDGQRVHEVEKAIELSVDETVFMRMLCKRPRYQDTDDSISYEPYRPRLLTDLIKNRWQSPDHLFEELTFRLDKEKDRLQPAHNTEFEITRGKIKQLWSELP